MKTLRFLFLAAVSMALIYACTKEGPAGPTGPAGPAGPTGATGPQGPQGVTGNANVVVYEYGAVTFTSETSFIMSNLTSAVIDESIVLAYCNVGTFWYPIPGPGPGGNYVTRNYWSQTNATTWRMYVSTYNWDGTSYITSKTFAALRIFIVKASSIMQGGKGSAVDLNDQDALYEYLNLPK